MRNRAPVWYVCYGTNISEERLTYYIRGGAYPVNGIRCRPCPLPPVSLTRTTFLTLTSCEFHRDLDPDPYLPEYRIPARKQMRIWSDRIPFAFFPCYNESIRSERSAVKTGALRKMS